MHDLIGEIRKVVETQVGLAVFAFFCSSFAALAELLRSQKELCVRCIVGAMLHSGLWGVAVALTLDDQIPGDHNFMILAVSIMAGIGGATVTDIVVSLIKRGLGIKISFDTGDEGK